MAIYSKKLYVLHFPENFVLLCEYERRMIKSRAEEEKENDDDILL